MAAVGEAHLPALGGRAGEGGASRRVVAALAFIVVIQTVVGWLVARGSYFNYDDVFVFTDLHRGAGFTLSYLLEDNAGHLSPGYRLEHWLLFRWGVPSWNAALASVLACLAVATVLLQRSLARLWGDAAWTFALALAFGVSLINLSMLFVFSVSGVEVPATMFSLAAIHAHLVWRDTRQRKWVVWSVAAIGLGLLFYIKTLLAPIYLALLLVFVLDPARSVHDGMRELWRARRVWGLYALPIAAFLAVYLTRGYGQRGHSPITADAVLQFLANAWLRAFGAGIFGISVGQPPPTGAETAAIVGAQLVIAALVTLSVWRRRPAWRGWAFFALSFLLAALAVAPRLREYDASIGANLRYIAEVPYLLPFALGFAFAGPPRAPGAAPAVVRRPPRPALAAAFGASALVAALTVSGVASFRHNQDGPKARAWVERLGKDVAAARARGRSAVLLDGRPSEALVPGFVYLTSDSGWPTTISEVAPFFLREMRGVRFEVAGQTEFRVAPDGALVPVRFVRTVGAAVGKLAQQGSVVAEFAVLRIANGRACVTTGPAAAAMEYAPARPLRGHEWYLDVEASASAARPLGLSVNRGAGYPLRADRRVSTGPGSSLKRSLVDLGVLPGVPTFARLRFQVPPNTSACFGNLQVGWFVDR